ncbi:hypothetical protein [Planococcus sp. YIM B11945]|uniref:hypothetical protein n=1 Tax=Planococcus sp. YIM B11945 TaxID=3435410 RepID=UPI003D7F0B3A
MRKQKASMTTEEVKRQNWISELRDLGVSFSPEGEDIRTLDYYSIRNLVMLEEVRREEA